MHPKDLRLALLAGLAALAIAAPALGDDAKAAAAKPAVSDAALIKSAMRAAPASVAKNATIVEMGADGKMRTLRAGTNGFTCMPGKPNTQGLDSMCFDKASLAWADAWMAHKPPPAGKVGMVYMLAGDSGASNTDPFATGPTPTNHFIKTGAHVMVVGADASFYDAYPKSADADVHAPYVMWAGTPYQHLMMPVK
jgi:hypothetical protein